MKRIITILALLLLVLSGVFGLSGCGGSGKGGGVKADVSKAKLKIVATIFPEYSWVKEVLGKQDAGAELTLLSKKGADMHSYQPGAEDILRIATCDLFIYVGGESDKWVDKALKEGGNPKRKVINLMKLLGNRVKAEEEVEGMEKHDHHGHDDGDDEGVAHAEALQQQERPAGQARHHRPEHHRAELGLDRGHPRQRR